MSISFKKTVELTQIFQMLHGKCEVGLYCLVIVNGLHFTIIFIFGTSILSFTMFQSRYIWMLAILIVCTYCGKDFQSLGRHSWRCKEKINTSELNKTLNVIQESDSHSTVDSYLL